MTFARRAAYLLGHGIIDSTGRGRGARYILSQASGVTTRGREAGRSSHAKIRESLYRYLTNRAPDGYSLSELQSCVPELSRRTLLRLLQDLRSAGRAYLAGRGRGARWFASDEMRRE